MVRGYVGIGYTFGWFASILFGGHYEPILRVDRPKLFIMGTADGFTSVRTFDKYFDRCVGPKEKYLINNIGHFELETPNYDNIIVDRMLDFLKRHLLPDAAQDGRTATRGVYVSA
mmetsp:Transcript_45383/g.128064  ORF Transcript_45383/g.128064 Transcript_45383/m.128064 type:complete len:115 (-) Transcript_45383:118-462(-)